MKHVGLAFVFVLIHLLCISQDTAHSYKPVVAKKTNIFSVGLGGQYGFVFAHTESVQNTKGSYPYGVELLLSWQRNDRKIVGPLQLLSTQRFAAGLL